MNSRSRSSRIVPVAVVQSAPKAFDLAATVESVDVICREARATGAELIVFPEAFLGGYPKGTDFGVRVGTRSAEGRQFFQRYFESAVDLSGPELRQLHKLVKELQITLVIGAIERVESGTLYCSALTIDDTGILNSHRKTMPTAMERVIWGCGDGTSVRAVETSVGRVSTAICWENYMPLLRTKLYQSNTAFYCAPTVDDRDSWIIAMRHIANEGRCFVLSACQYATRADYPADYESSFGDDPDTELIRGGSCIVDPFGNLLAGPIYGKAEIIYADLDVGLITQGKFDLDVVGHYSRSDIFKL